MFLAIFLIIFCKITCVLRDKENARSIVPIYNEEKLDVIFMGSSTTEWLMIPMRLWEEKGIVSFNAAHPNFFFIENIYLIKDYIERFSPKVIVMDITELDKYIDEGKKIENIENYENFTRVSIHKGTDNMKFSLNKLKLISCLPKKYKLETLFNVIAFHYRWKEIGMNDFLDYSASKDKGMNYSTGISQTDIVHTSETFPLQNITKKYILELKDLCTNSGVKLIFIATPTGREYYGRLANSLINFFIAENIEYINFYDLVAEIGLDANNDMFDSVHVNINGAKKITSYIGSYLIEKGYVTDRRNDLEFSKWHEDYENSEYFKIYSGK